MTSTTPRTAPPEPPVLPAPQRWGGLASWVVAATYVLGFAMMVVHLVPAGFTDPLSDPTSSLTFLLEHRAALYLWYLMLYVLGGVALVVLILGVHDRMARSHPSLSRISAATGLIWAGHLLASGMIALIGQRAVAQLAEDHRERAETIWISVSVIQDALGGGIELVGATWLLLVSFAAFRARMFSRGLAALGLLIGVAGVLTLVPAVAETAAVVFGLGLIVWFVQAGLELRRS